MSGWIKLHRSLSQSSIADNPDCLSVWVHMLMCASHQENDLLVGKQIVPLLPGQFIYGRHKFAVKTGLPEKRLRTVVSLLEKLGMVAIKRTNKFSIISITNWCLYQSEGPTDEPTGEPADDPTKGQQRASKGPTKGQQRASKGPTKGQQRATNKNVKNEKNGEKGKNINNASDDPPAADPVAEVFAHWQTVMGKTGAVKLTADRRRKIQARLREGYTVDQLKQAVDGCASSSFHMGQDPRGNPEGTIYDDLELICRNGSKVESFIQKSHMKPQRQESSEALSAWLAGSEPGVIEGEAYREPH